MVSREEWGVTTRGSFRKPRISISTYPLRGLRSGYSEATARCPCHLSRALMATRDTQGSRRQHTADGRIPLDLRRRRVAEMALKDISDPGAVEQAIAQFDELGREQFLKLYGFRRARRFLLEYDGKVYDSKAILGAAHGIQFPDEGPLSWKEFSGGEATTVKKLADLGFHVVASPVADDPTAEPARPISELLPEVLELQHYWSQKNTQKMQQRGALIRKEIPDAVRMLLPADGSLPFTPSIEGSDGAGLKSRVPWVRVFSAPHSPSAMNGWYVVILFAADGSAAYVTLGSGTSQMIDGQFKLRPPSSPHP